MLISALLILTSATLSWPIFNTAHSTISPNTIIANISGYTIAIIAMHSMDIATVSHML